MTITQSSTRLAALTLGVAAVVAFAFAAIEVAPAHAASVCPGTVWSANLKVGSNSSDVMKLQQFLNMDPDTMVASTGVGSQGMESKYFGSMTKAAVNKFQTKYAADILTPLGLTKPTGNVAAATRAKLNALCAGATAGSGTGTGTGTGTPAAGSVMVSAGAQPANAIAPQGASRVPFTTFTITAPSSGPVTINGVTVQRVGYGVDANFSGIVLLDQNGLQVGTAKTLNSNHQAILGDTFTIPAGQSMTFTVAGNMGASLAATAGQVVALQVVGVNSSATVSGALPITGAAHVINATLSVGSVSTTTSAFDPGANQTRNIGDVAVRYSGVKFQSGSTEDLKLYSVRWRQVGSASGADLANVMTVVNGTSYPATVDASGKYYTTLFPGGITITKGNSVDVYVQGDIVGSNASGRTIEFDIDKVTDVYFIGQLYGFGVAPSGTYTPWFKGYTVTVQGGTVTTLSKANTGAAAAQNIAINVPNQPLGGFTTNFAGEPVSVQGMTFTVATSTAATGLLQNVSVVDSNGAVVAGPVDATWVSGVQTLTFTDTVTFPVGVRTYYVQGKVPSTAVGGAGIALSTSPSAWTNPVGQTTGNTVSLGSVASITMNTMTVKGGAVTVSLSSTPASQNIVAGVANFTFANVVLNAQNSGEDIRLANLPILFAGNAANLTGCQIFDGATALNTSSRVVNAVVGGKNTFSFDNVLRVTKGTTKTLALNCNLSSQATSSSSYKFSSDTTSGDYAITGDTSGVSITPTLPTSNGGTMTVQTASMTLAVDSSSPASTTVSGGSTGQTVAVYKLRATNDTITLTKLGMKLTSGSAGDIAHVWLYNGATLIGDATFGNGQTEATSSLSTPLTLPANTDVKVTVKVDFADVGTGLSGTEGSVVQLNPSNAEGNSTTGLAQAVGTGTTGGVRLYNSFPVFTYSTTGATLINGVNDLMTLNVAADQQGDVGLYKLVFTLATTTVTVSSPTFSGPNGAVGQSAPSINAAGNTITVTFDSTSNTADSTVGAGTMKTYVLRGTVSGLTGSNSGSVSVALTADTSASALTTAAAVSGNIVWSPLATTSIDVNTTDWTNGYALTQGCFASVGLGNNCTARVLAK